MKIKIIESELKNIISNKIKKVLSEEKYPELKKEHGEKINNLLNDCQVFWAFSNEQFVQNKVPLEPGDKYVSIGSGGYMPKSKVNDFINGQKEIKKWYSSAMKTEKGNDEQEILDQLRNHEAFYTGDITDTYLGLDKRYSLKQIYKVYIKYKDQFMESIKKTIINVLKEEISNQFSNK